MPLLEIVDWIFEAFIACVLTMMVPVLTTVGLISFVEWIDHRVRQRFNKPGADGLNSPMVWVMGTPIMLGILVSVWIAMPAFLSTARPLTPFGKLTTWFNLVGVPATWSVAILFVTDRLNGPSLYTRFLRSISIERPSVIENPLWAEGAVENKPWTKRLASAQFLASVLSYSLVILVPIELIYGLGIWWVIGGLFAGGWLMRQIVTLVLLREYDRQKEGPWW